MEYDVDLAGTASAPEMALSMRAASSTVRARGPTQSRDDP